MMMIVKKILNNMFLMFLKRGPTYKYCGKNDLGIWHGRRWNDWIWRILQSFGAFRGGAENVNPFLELTMWPSILRQKPTKGFIPTFRRGTKTEDWLWYMSKWKLLCSKLDDNPKEIILLYKRVDLLLPFCTYY